MLRERWVVPVLLTYISCYRMALNQFGSIYFQYWECIEFCKPAGLQPRPVLHLNTMIVELYAVIVEYHMNNFTSTINREVGESYICHCIE